MPMLPVMRPTTSFMMVKSKLATTELRATFCFFCSWLLIGLTGGIPAKVECCKLINNNDLPDNHNHRFRRF
jgi:hypothetical protein